MGNVPLELHSATVRRNSSKRQPETASMNAAITPEAYTCARVPKLLQYKATQAKTYTEEKTSDQRTKTPHSRLKSRALNSALVPNFVRSCTPFTPTWLWTNHSFALRTDHSQPFTLLEAVLTLPLCLKSVNVTRWFCLSVRQKRTKYHTCSTRRASHGTFAAAPP